MRALLILFVSILISIPVFALPTYTGYSGSPGRQTCAASCHGAGGGTVQVIGFPASYTPSQTYLITVKKISGSAIKNFNASCRLATGSTNAGTITSGQFTSTYNVAGETNGVHMSSLDHDSAQFNWTAPAAGLGILRLYVGAHQGTQGGPNTAIVMASTEAPTLPGPATNPTPPDGATGISPNIGLHWTAGTGSSTSDVYYGNTNPPPLLAQFFEGVFFDPEPNPDAGATYYWRIDARNDHGVTPGAVWSFTVMNAPGQATDPIPADMATGVTLNANIECTPGADATSHDFFVGTAQDDLGFVGNFTSANYLPDSGWVAGTTYFWRVDERNDVGVDTGVVWQFTTGVMPLAASNPSPADSAIEVNPATQLSWMADPNGATHFDIYLGTQNPPPLFGSSQSANFDPPGLQPGVTYFWQVTTFNNIGSTDGPLWEFTTQASAANDPHGLLPSDVTLGPAYPNPFNAVVTISYGLPQAGDVQLTVYDLLGREVATLARRMQTAGWHSVAWNAENTGSGVYLVRLTSAGRTVTQKIVALK